MTTPRVERLLAEGISIAARRLYGVEVTSREAHLLARGGSVWVALEKLGKRLEVKRSVPGDQERDRAFQERLAIVEVAVEMSGVFDAKRKRELVTGLLDAEASLRIEHEGGAAEAIDDTVEKLREQGDDLGRFTRLAHRLFGEQRAALEVQIRDDALRRDALTQLEAIYTRYFHLATQLSMPGVPTRRAAEALSDAG